jgi:chaperonin GroES
VVRREHLNARFTKPLRHMLTHNLSFSLKEKSMAKSIRPLGDRILIKRIEAEQKTAGGILIPDNAKEKPAEGKVIAVGNGKTLEDGKVAPLTVKAGDTVLFGKWSGTEVKLDGEEHILLKEDEVLAILDK